MKGTYTIHIASRRFRWLPWPKEHLVMEKETTWQDAERWANNFREAGATVHVHAGTCAESEDAA